MIAQPEQPSGRRFSVIELGALVPLLAAVFWLPLAAGGSDSGPLIAVETLTFATILLLAVRRRIVIPSGPAGRIMLVLAGLGFAASISTIFSRDLDVSVPLFMQWLWLAAAGLIVATVVVPNPRLRELLIGSLMGAVVIQVAWAYYIWWSGGVGGRVQFGTFYAPNQYAGYLLLLAPLFLSVTLIEKSRTKAAAWGLLTVFVYLGITLSGSRAGAGAAVVGVVVVAALAARGRIGEVLARTILLVVGFVAAGAFMTGPVLFPDRPPAAGGSLSSLRMKGVSGASASMRLHWAQGALLIGIRSPLTGTGLGTYGDAFFDIRDPSWQWSRYAHNHYLEAFAEGGMPLFAGTIALPLVAMAPGFRKLRKSSPTDSIWQIGLGAGLLGASIHLIFDHDWSYPAYAAAYIVVSLLFAAPWPSTKEDQIFLRTDARRAIVAKWLWK